MIKRTHILALSVLLIGMYINEGLKCERDRARSYFLHYYGWEFVPHEFRRNGVFPKNASAFGAYMATIKGTHGMTTSTYDSVMWIYQRQLVSITPLRVQKYKYQYLITTRSLGRHRCTTTIDPVDPDKDYVICDAL